ncbi:MAG: cytochrome c-type biosis protein CcmF [Thermoleophilaceae bacterium]|nr:cytochrome c-type biosis protein CcmF [Thermoleophilaceae bacterium]MEA2353704.1 cytochrome c-type biosis protein CcmF [Thermoleophilaceae bacterium]MEA2369042.1 cytochrome c-type biosis protein CcmF [Thermoleophilaceae bacterium]
MTGAVGNACLAVGLGAALYAAGAGVYGARSGRREFVTSARWAMYCLAGLLTIAMIMLESAYLRTDLSFKLVAQNSSHETPTFYKLTALWSSQEGSLLLWAFLLSVYSSVVLLVTRRKLREIVPWATAVLGVVAAFFLSLMIVFGQNPFAKLARAPVDGNGLEPLLRHPAMAIHPPMLYSGYVGFAIPFAFAVGALITRRTGADWIRSTRRFALVAWTLLGTGILLGALWSYSELGWGGYWAWDAVENASLMPWLLGTAFIHSVMVQEKRGMLKMWNAGLIMATFTAALIGTFLVRSGILDSIHAFGASTLGVPFLIFIGVVAIGSVVLLVSRRDSLRSEGQLESLLSRETFFLLNNLVLVVLCLVIFWGTFFPLISEAVTGTKQSWGPPMFERWTVPLALLLALLSGIGPLLTWRRASPATVRRALKWPLVATAVALGVMLVVTPAAESVTSLIMFTLIAFVLAAVAQEFLRGASARRVMARESWPAAMASLVRRNRRRYGGYLVHAGIAILFLGVAASSGFHAQKDVSLRPGQSTRIDGYTVTYRRPTAGINSDRGGTGAPISLGAVLDVRRGGDHWTMRPSRNYYKNNDGTGGVFGQYFTGDSTSEVDLRWGLKRDFWMAVQPDTTGLMKPLRELNRRFSNASERTQIAGFVALMEVYRRTAPPAQFRAIVSPMIAWIWIGGAIVLVGTLTALWPTAEARRRRAASLAAARLGRELSRA